MRTTHNRAVTTPRIYTNNLFVYMNNTGKDIVEAVSDFRQYGYTKKELKKRINYLHLIKNNVNFVM
jgi:hypothetical protein